MRTIRIAGLAALLAAAACGAPADRDATPVRVVRVVVNGAPAREGAVLVAAERRTASVSTPARPL
jgi:ABC-type glycerol-3-phosphate transport system substrate-binding protein